MLYHIIHVLYIELYMSCNNGVFIWAFIGLLEYIKVLECNLEFFVVR